MNQGIHYHHQHHRHQYQSHPHGIRPYCLPKKTKTKKGIHYLVLSSTRDYQLDFTVFFFVVI